MNKFKFYIFLILPLLATNTLSQSNSIFSLNSEAYGVDALPGDVLALKDVLFMAVTTDRQARLLTGELSDRLGAVWETLFVLCEKGGKTIGLTVYRRPYASDPSDRIFNNLGSVCGEALGVVRYVELVDGKLSLEDSELWIHLNQHAREAYSFDPTWRKKLIGKWFREDYFDTASHKILVKNGLSKAPLRLLPGIDSTVQSLSLSNSLFSLDTEAKGLAALPGDLVVVKDVLFLAVTTDKQAPNWNLADDPPAGIKESLFILCEKGGKTIGLSVDREPYASDPSDRVFKIPAIHFSDPLSIIRNIEMGGKLDPRNKSLWTHLDQFASEAYSFEAERRHKLIGKWFKEDYFDAASQEFLIKNGFKKAPPRLFPEIDRPK